MTEVSDTPTAPAGFVVATTQPAWWLHILTTTIAVAAFVAGVIHPGYHLPAVVAASVGVASVALAGLSAAIVALEHHDFGLHQSIPVAEYLANVERFWSTQIEPQLAASHNVDLEALDARLIRVEQTANGALAVALNAQKPSTPPGVLNESPTPPAAQTASTPLTAPPAGT